MKGKIGLAVGLAVGYVLGTRGGRQQYEQLKRQAQQLWRRPEVQAKVDQAGQLASEAATKAADAGKEAVDRATTAGKEAWDRRHQDDPRPPA